MAAPPALVVVAPPAAGTRVALGTTPAAATVSDGLTPVGRVHVRLGIRADTRDIGAGVRCPLHADREGELVEDAELHEDELDDEELVRHDGKRLGDRGKPVGTGLTAPRPANKDDYRT